MGAWKELHEVRWVHSCRWEVGKWNQESDGKGGNQWRIWWKFGREQVSSFFEWSYWTCCHAKIMHCLIDMLVYLREAGAPPAAPDSLGRGFYPLILCRVTCGRFFYCVSASSMHAWTLACILLAMREDSLEAWFCVCFFLWMLLFVLSLSLLLLLSSSFLASTLKAKKVATTWHATTTYEFFGL